jgi:hypothetical protein
MRILANVLPRAEVGRAFYEIAATGVAPRIHTRAWLSRGEDGRIRLTTFWTSSSTAESFTPERIKHFVETNDYYAKHWRGKSAQEIFTSDEIPECFEFLRDL